MNLETYPQRIVKPLIELEKTSDLAAEHKLLLDLGETLLTHITGILFGEYKRNWDVNEALESEFYRNAKKKPSFGVFLNLLRLLIKAEGKSVCDEYFDKGRNYPAVSEFVFNYELLKSGVVNKGTDNGFKEAMEPLKKGRTVGAKSGLEFFESFVAVRNTYAHPEEKAKNPLRNWPLGDEYYGLINPLMKDALTELISSFTVLSTHRPVLVKELDDQQHKGSFVEEIGKKEKELALELSDEDLDFVNTDVRYLLDQDNKLFSKFYQAEVPQVNPSVAKQIIEKEKAKMMEPVLLDMIRQKLEDGVIDELEYMVLRDTALSSFITEERLKQLIEKIRQEIGLGEDIYVLSKPIKSEMLFNPYWIIHFGTLHENKVEQSDDPFNTTNLHKNLWKEVSLYLQTIIDKYLNNEISQWKIKTNQYQIGNLSYTYWGQIYPENSPFENAFSIGVAISKKFKWASAKRGTEIWKKLSQPSLIIWPTTYYTLIERIDQDGSLNNKYRELQTEQIKNNKEKFSELKMIAREVFFSDEATKSGSQAVVGSNLQATAISYIDEYIKMTENKTNFGTELYSPIWNIDEFCSNQVVDYQKTLTISNEIKIFLTMFSNIIEQINDFSLNIGINKETISSVLDVSMRKEKLLVNKIKEYQNNNKTDKYSMKELKQYAEEIGLKKNQITIVFSRARWDVDKE